MLDDIRQFLVTCSGEDNSILNECGPHIKRRFALLGFFVLLIFIGCMASAGFFTYSLFNEAKYLSIPLGLVWGMVVVNLYLLLLHTISPPIIPLSAKKKKSKLLKTTLSDRYSFFSFSMMSRIGFIVLLAMIIAQPISVFCLSSSITNIVESHMIEQRVQLYTLSNKRIIHQEIKEHQSFINKISHSLTHKDQQAFNNQLSFLQEKMAEDKLFLVNSTSKIERLKKLNDEAVNIKKNTEKKQLIADLDHMLSAELESDHKFLETLDRTNLRGSFNRDFIEFKTDLSGMIKQKIANYDALVDLLDRSNFYVMKIQLLLQQKFTAWLITLTICLIFLLPIFFKYKARNLSAKLFLEEDHTARIKKLRKQLIQTSDFPWLKSALLSSSLSKINTSDYYFQRMYIEHRIILEQYEEAKVEYSRILSERVLQYNRNCLQRVLKLLVKLKNVRPAKYVEISKQLYHEYDDQIIKKYEYWLDCPFRTERRTSPFSIKNNEKALLDFLYSDPEENQ